ncbi:immunoglobulin superfamily DCC subclass member 4 isoform X2 [Anabrus simplex]|uniref:immunoglobulin superfamily DCC subclass member 4 isoform X2 n=1 Tax=Anabrus simplex TaxID=316456 RepID=UPI0034DCF384
MVIKKLLDIFLLVVIADGCCYASDPELQEMTVDVGGNITLSCTDTSASLSPVDSDSIMWIREGRNEKQINRLSIQPDGGLTLTHLNRGDAGIYSCTLESKPGNTTSAFDVVRKRVKVEVRTPPPALVNVTVHPSTVLALLLWNVADTGGYEIEYFTAQYRKKHPDINGKHDEWHFVKPEHITPNVRQIDVYQLDPNTSYQFKIWATNQLGPGQETVLEGTTLHNMEEIELARLLLKDAKDFDTRVWVVAVVVVMGTLLILAIGTCYLLYREYHVPNPQPPPVPKPEPEVVQVLV